MTLSESMPYADFRKNYQARVPEEVLEPTKEQLKDFCLNLLGRLFISQENRFFEDLKDGRLHDLLDAGITDQLNTLDIGITQEDADFLFFPSLGLANPDTVTVEIYTQKH